MPRVAAPKDPHQLNNEAQDEIQAQIERLESAANKLKKAAKKLRLAQKPIEPKPAA